MGRSCSLAGKVERSEAQRMHKESQSSRFEVGVGVGVGSAGGPRKSVSALRLVVLGSAQSGFQGRATGGMKAMRRWRG